MVGTQINEGGRNPIPSCTIARVGERGRTVRAAMLIGFGAFVILTWTARAWYGRWIADDYCFAVSSVRDGFWQSQAHVYMTAAGRFSVAFLYALLTRLGPWTAPVFAIAAMATWILASWRAAHHALHTLLIEEIALAVGFVGAVLNAAPDTYQPLIWTGGLFTYGIPVIGISILAAGVLGGTSPALLALLSFFFAGCSEIAAAAQVVFAVGLAVVYPRFRRAVVAIAIGSLAGFILVAIAPGNFQRRTLFQPLPISQALITAATSAPLVLWGFLRDGFLLFVPLVAFIASLRAPTREDARRSTVLVVCAVVVVVGALFAGLVGTGRLPWGRVLFVPVAYFTVALALIRWPRPRFGLTALMAIAGLLGCLISAQSRFDAIRDARDFARAADRVRAVALQSKGQAVKVAAPRTYEYLEYLAADPNHWTNRCVADYYDLTSISRR